MRSRPILFLYDEDNLANAGSPYAAIPLGALNTKIVNRPTAHIRVLPRRVYDPAIEMMVEEFSGLACDRVTARLDPTCLN